MSTLTADIIENSSGQRVLVNGYPAQPNRVLEYLAGPCDGSTVTVASGRYTLPNVTAQQGGSTAYQVVTGSDIYYCPPPGTREVKYQFTFSIYWLNQHAINHYRFHIGDNEILQARHDRAGEYTENRYTFEWTIPITGFDNNNIGTVASWTTAKRLYMTFRWYGTSNANNHHGTTYWDGVASNQFNIPILSIVAVT